MYVVCIGQCLSEKPSEENRAVMSRKGRRKIEGKKWERRERRGKEE